MIHLSIHHWVNQLLEVFLMSEVHVNSKAWLLSCDSVPLLFGCHSGKTRKHMPFEQPSHSRSKISFSADIYVRLQWWHNATPVCVALLLELPSAKLMLSCNSGLCSLVASSEAFPWLPSIKCYPSLVEPWFIFSSLHLLLPDISICSMVAFSHQNVCSTRAKTLFHKSCLLSALRAASHGTGAQWIAIEWMK